VDRLRADYTRADLAPVDRALCDLALRLTATPWSAKRDQLDRLRKLGLSDRALHDAVQIIAYFNYINRVADGLGIDLEPEMPPAGACGVRN